MKINQFSAHCSAARRGEARGTDILVAGAGRRGGSSVCPARPAPRDLARLQVPVARGPPPTYTRGGLNKLETRRRPAITHSPKRSSAPQVRRGGGRSTVAC